MRAFIALELPEVFVEETLELARDLRSCVDGRFVPATNYHLTLAFLGDVDERDVASAMAALDAVADQCVAPSLVCTGLGTFGRANDATLWLGLDDSIVLRSLASIVREELGSRGLAFDTKSFKPHITLARRVRIPRGSLPPLGFPRDAQGVRVTLFKSELSREGATYKALYSVDLNRVG